LESEQEQNPSQKCYESSGPKKAQSKSQRKIVEIDENGNEIEEEEFEGNVEKQEANK
jgi:hypothetical protein